MDRRKKYYLMIDTETANGLDDPFVYDCGFAVIDKKGKIYEEHSYVIYDVFVGMKDLMQSAYYAWKLPMYERQLKAGERRMVKYSTLRKILREVCERWSISAIIAHNMPFDYKALTKTQRYLTQSAYRYFLPYGVPIWCTKAMVNDTIAKQKSYRMFCEEHADEYMFNGKPRVTAEILYRYLTGQPDFVEEHTGLADVRIESLIFVQCMRQHKRMRKNPYNSRELSEDEKIERGWEIG